MAELEQIKSLIDDAEVAEPEEVFISKSNSVFGGRKVVSSYRSLNSNKKA